MLATSLQEAVIDLYYQYFEQVLAAAMLLPYMATCLAAFPDADFDVCYEKFQVTVGTFMRYFEEVVEHLLPLIQEKKAVEQQRSKVASSTSKKFISGYWEDWAGAINPNGTNDALPSYYANDIAPFTHVMYAFLTLSANPNPWDPVVGQWDGKALYENMTAADITKVMPITDPTWANPYDWQRKKIQALMDATHAVGGKFIWSIGGWSDLTQTIAADQVDAFVDHVVKLLKISGDGVDLDWEHLSSKKETRD